MKIKMNMIIVIAIAFCFTASIFMAIPIESQTAKTYNPLADINEDGKVSLQDLVLLANAYGTNGTPVNVTDLQNQITNLQNRVTSLEAQANSVKTIRFYTPNETMTNDTSWKDAAVFMWTPQNATNNAMIQGSCYCQYLTNDSAYYQLVFRILINDNSVLSNSENNYGTEYQQTILWHLGTWDGGLVKPNQSTYAVKFQVECGANTEQAYVKDINVLLQVMDGLPPS